MPKLFVSWYCKAAGHSSGEETGERGPATEPNSHTLTVTAVLVTGVLLTVTASYLYTQGWQLCGVTVVGASN